MEWQTQIAGGVVPPKRGDVQSPQKTTKIRNEFIYAFGVIYGFRANLRSEYHILYLATKLFNKFQSYEGR